MVKHRGLLSRLIAERSDKERERFGLDPDIPQKLSQEEEEEKMLVIDNDDDSLTDLPWYIINPNKMLYKCQNTQIQMMTWITVVLTPLVMCFEL